MRRILLPILVCSISIALSLQVRAAMQNGAFRIDSDSINVGGVDIGQSDTFQAQDTLGEHGTGVLRNGAMEIQAGYRGAVGTIAAAAAAETSPQASPSQAPPSTLSGAVLPPGSSTAFNATFTLSYVGDSSALIAWNGTKDNTATISWGLSADNLTETRTTPSPISVYTFALAPLTPQTRYFFTISATDVNGAHVETTVFSFDTQADYLRPWRDTGFLDGEGNKRIGFATWNEVYALPKIET